MTTASDHTNRLFIDAALSDKDRGYPNGTAFVAVDNPDWRRITLRNLLQGQPTVLVTGDATEFLFIPRRRLSLLRLLDRARKQVPSYIRWRHAGHEYEFAMNVDRHALEQLERAA
jgi:hypothetical protein